MSLVLDSAARAAMSVGRQQSAAAQVRPRGSTDVPIHITAQAQILEAVATGAALRSTPDELASFLGIGLAEVISALRRLVELGLVTAGIDRNGQLVVCKAGGSAA